MSFTKSLLLENLLNVLSNMHTFAQTLCFHWVFWFFWVCIFRNAVFSLGFLVFLGLGGFSNFQAGSEVVVNFEKAPKTKKYKNLMKTQCFRESTQFAKDIQQILQRYGFC